MPLQASLVNGQFNCLRKIEIVGGWVSQKKEKQNRNSVLLLHCTVYEIRKQTKKKKTTYQAGQAGITD